MSGSDVSIRREGRAGRITLDRPKALNALTHPMVGAIRAALDAWATDPEVHLVLVDGAGEKGLCAGGDVRALYDARSTGSATARAFWADEYRLNALIARYPKPYVALMDGIVMGGGIGLSAHGSHRVVTERSMLAMPETTIGLIPDVGGTWLLGRAPGAFGPYLGLVGHRMNGADAILADLADTQVPSARLPELIDGLVATTEAVSVVIAMLAQAPQPSHIARHREEIDAAFGQESVVQILSALVAMPGAWAEATRAALATRSPLALAATLAAIRRARGLPSLEAALAMEFRLVTHLYEGGEFIEGVRALLVDKDKAPRWRPAGIADVTEEMVAGLMSPLVAGQEWQPDP